MRPIEIRIKKTPNMPTRITVVYEGVGNTAVHWCTCGWRDWLTTRRLISVPRIWE